MTNYSSVVVVCQPLVKGKLLLVLFWGWLGCLCVSALVLQRVQISFQNRLVSFLSFSLFFSHFGVSFWRTSYLPVIATLFFHSLIFLEWLVSVLLLLMPFLIGRICGGIRLSGLVLSFSENVLTSSRWPVYSRKQWSDISRSILLSF